MDVKQIFLDNNATTRPSLPVQEAMLYAMNEGFGNPSSGHRGGEAARRIVARARDRLAELVSALPTQIFFTSGATESNNWVIQSYLHQHSNSAVFTTEAEHSSVKELVQHHPGIRHRVTNVPVSRDGLVQVDHLLEECGGTAGLLSIHWVNNETGAIQPIERIVDICKTNGIRLHVDGSQAVGKLNVDLTNLEIDFLTFTAHKFHGPQGIGAVFCRTPSQLIRSLYGGGQESGIRPGTEKSAGIAGFGKAAELRKSNLASVIGHMAALRDDFEQRVLATVPNTSVNGSRVHRVCNTTNLLFEGVDGQALVAQLDANGIRCSQSSACTTQIPEPSYVLRAMGLSEKEAYSSVRFSFSELNTHEEVDDVVQALQVLTKRVKAWQYPKGIVASS